MNFIEFGVETILLVEKTIFQKITTHFFYFLPTRHRMTIATVESWFSKIVIV